MIADLCVKFAEENPGWGYERIQGALTNLGYRMSKTTVGNILRRAGLCPSPDRTGKSSWRQFIRAHLATTCVADFLTTEVWTVGGLVRYHVLFVMNLAKREVEIAQINCQTNGQVMAQVARNLTDAEDGFLQGMEYFVCDRDSFDRDARVTREPAESLVLDDPYFGYLRPAFSFVCSPCQNKLPVACRFMGYFVLSRWNGWIIRIGCGVIGDIE